MSEEEAEADTPQVSHNVGPDEEEEEEMEMRHDNLHYANNKKMKKKKKKKKHHCKTRRGKALAEAKELVLSLFRKRPISLRTNNKPSATTTTTGDTKAKTSQAWIFGGCCRLCFCLNRPAPGSPAAADDADPSSDPNSPSFTYEMLRSLIEKNEFYSRDCSPHLAALRCIHSPTATATATTTTIADAPHH